MVFWHEFVGVSMSVTGKAGVLNANTAAKYLRNKLGKEKGTKLGPSRTTYLPHIRSMSKQENRNYFRVRLISSEMVAGRSYSDDCREEYCRTLDLPVMLSTYRKCIGIFHYELAAPHAVLYVRKKRPHFVRDLCGSGCSRFG